MNNDYEPVIGIEVHAQLATVSKMFCACPNNFGDEPNSNTCPVCLGLPGSLPSVNRQAVILGVKAGRALGCQLPPVAQFARKNYFYPDLPKGYQVSMHQFPLGVDGCLQLLTDHGELTAGVKIERTHLEEDSARLIHDENRGSMLDFNRAGVPLLEIVSKPDIRTASEAVWFLKELRRVLRFFGISNANMEEGSFRCEVNISLRPVGSEDHGARVEIKNLNSFKSVERSIEYEINRQSQLYKKGGEVRLETRGWNEKIGETVHQRYKEKSPEYRYFPEPDLPELVLSDEITTKALIDLERLPVRRIRSLIERFGVPVYSAELLMSGTGAPETNPYYVAEFFEKAIERHGAFGTLAVNLITGTIFEYLNRTGKTLDQSDLTSKKLAEITKLVASDEISSTCAKSLVNILMEEGGQVEDIMIREGLIQVSDDDEIVKLVKQVIEENQPIVESIRKGKVTAIGALVGATMKKSDGQANPKKVNEILQDLILRKKSN